MTGMSTFVESEHPRGGASNAGRFRAKGNSAPETAVGTTGDADAGERFLGLVRTLARSGIGAREFERVMRAALASAADDGLKWPTAEHIGKAMRSGMPEA